MLTDLKHAARGLRQTPLLTLSIILVLGTALGVLAAAFGVVDAVLLDPLPFEGSERVVLLWQRAPGVGVAEDWFSPAQYFDLREGVGAFESIAIFGGAQRTLVAAGVEPERIGALAVSSSFFEVVRIAPVLGRAFERQDDAPGADPVALISNSLFERRFGGDPAILGQTLELDGRATAVVGVLADGLTLDADLFPTLSTVPRFDAIVSMPLEDPGVTRRGSENFNIIARMATTATPERVASELLNMAAVFRLDADSLAAGLDAGSGFRIDAEPWREGLTADVRAPLSLLGAAGLVLVFIACANAGGLLLARSRAERTELGMRTALGAAPGRIVRLSAFRSGLLALGAGGLAALLSALILAWIRTAAPAGLPRVHEVVPNAGLLAFCVVASFAVALLFGAAPALRDASVRPNELLADGAASARSTGRSTGRAGMVALQVALSVVLASQAVVLVGGMRRLNAVDPGFEPQGASSFRLSLVGERYADRGARIDFFRDLFAAVSERTGGAGGVSLLPMTRGFAWTDFTVDGFEAREGRDRVVADILVATSGYPQALGMRVLAGRLLRDGVDDESPAVIVNRAFAERFWGVDDAVGHWVENDFRGQSTIVGVVENVRQYGLDADPRLAVYYPHSTFGSGTLYGVVRAGEGQDPNGLIELVREEVNRRDASLPVYGIRSMPDRVRDSLARQRLVTTLMNIFGVFALGLAAVGLYGLAAAWVTARRREFGVRRSLGAVEAQIVTLVVGQSLRPALAGTALGAVVALVGGRAVGDLVAGGGSPEPLAVGIAAGLALLVTAISAWVPARRAARVEPAVALRS